MMFSSGWYCEELIPTINFLTPRDVNDSEDWYETISVIEFKGTLSLTGQSEGHYICNVKN